VRGKSVKTRLLFVAHILSFPLCLVPIFLWAGLAIPFMVAEFTLVNQSGETLYITPVNFTETSQRLYVPERLLVGQIRAFRQADIRLAAGESIQILYDAETRPYVVAVRNEAGDYRQVAIDRGARTLLLDQPEIMYTIGPFATLAPIDEKALLVAQQAPPFNFGFWGFMLTITVLFGGVPVGLLWAWFRRVRQGAHSEDKHG
jgi:hypothetical protein